MKEIPILFTGAMVRAILEGRKTQTRRVVKNATGPFFDHSAYEPVEIRHGEWAFRDKSSKSLLTAATGSPVFRCPYGTRGDRLWGKEAFQTGEFAHNEPRGTIYRATDPDWETTEGWKWKPSIFMPREASRLLLEVTQVRVQRLQEISDADSIAEGILECWPGAWHWTTDTGMAAGLTPRNAYRTLWNSINLDPKPIYARDDSGTKIVARYESFPWSIEDFIARHGVGKHGVPLTYRGEPLIIHANPYVWAISFQKIQP